MPTTLRGRWSCGLVLAVQLFLGLFFAAVAAGERGGDAFLSNPLLAVPVLFAAASETLALVLAAVSIVKDRERSLIVFLSVLLGLAVTAFWLAEVLLPH